jgi:hypothetical protein
MLRGGVEKGPHFLAGDRSPVVSSPAILQAPELLWHPCSEGPQPCPPPLSWWGGPPRFQGHCLLKETERERSSPAELPGRAQGVKFLNPSACRGGFLVHLRLGNTELFHGLPESISPHMLEGSVLGTYSLPVLCE